MLTKPIFKAMALLVALSLSLPNPALALRTREAGELPETLSGLEEALQTSPDAVLHEIGRTIRSLLPKPLPPSIPAAGLEENEQVVWRGNLSDLGLELVERMRKWKKMGVPFLSMDADPAPVQGYEDRLKFIGANVPLAGREVDDVVGDVIDHLETNIAQLHPGIDMEYEVLVQNGAYLLRDKKGAPLLKNRKPVLAPGVRIRRALPAGPEERVTVFSDKNLSSKQLRFKLNKYVPWGFSFYDPDAPAEQPENPGRRAGFPLLNTRWKKFWQHFRNRFIGNVSFSPDDSWQGWGSLHPFIMRGERPQFDLTIIRNASPDVPAGRTFAFIVGRSAGLEERNLNQILSQLADAIQGSGVVVFGPETSSRAGLEELVWRAPPEFLKRMVFWVGAARAAELRKLNPAVQVVPDNDVNKLAALLISLPEADQVTVLGTLSLAQLQRLLPTTMAVIQLDPSIAFQLILAALGVPNSVLNQVDAADLEESLARARAA